jgi:hypothetical protein
MSHQKFQPKLTGDDTEEIASYRRVLGGDIGSLEHPYFSTSVRKYDKKFGKKASMPKFAALMKKNEWRADSSLQAYKRRHERRKTANIPGGKNLKKMIAKNEKQSQDNASNSKNASDHDVKSASGNNVVTNTSMATNSNKKKRKKNDGNNRKNGSSPSNDGNKDGNQKKNNNVDAFATLDAKAKKQIAEKRKVAKAWYKMACSIRVRSAIVKDGAVKAIALLSTIPDETIRGYCSDSLCELADFPDSRSQMIEDGAAKALLKLCKSPSRATQFSCALALGSLACETGYENDLIEMGVLAELMERQKSATETKNVREEYTSAVARAVFNFACVDEYMMSVQSTSPRLEDVVSAAFVLSSTRDRNVRLLCYRTLTCLARVASLRKSLVKAGGVTLMNKFRMDKSFGEEGALLCAVTLCLLSFTNSCRLPMMEQGAGQTAISGVRLAIETLQEKKNDGGNNNSNSSGSKSSSKSEGENDDENVEMDILCMTVATLTNLALTSSTRTLIINDGVVPIILQLIELGDEPVKRACAATLRGLTLDDDATIIKDIVDQGGLEAILRLCQVTDLLILRNCSSALRNILSHNELLEMLFNDKKLIKKKLNTLTVNTLLKLLQGTDVEIIRHCSFCLYNTSCISSGWMDGKCRDILVSSGAVAAAVRIVELGTQDDVQFIYAGTLLNLSYCEKYSNRMHAEHATDALVTLINRGNEKVIHQSCCTIFNMVTTTEFRQNIINNSDVVETLLKLSVSKLDDARIMCGAILCRLASDQSCAKQFVDLGLLQALITLVSWYDQLTRQRCIVAMVKLADGDGMRPRLVEEGAVPALINLLSSHDKVMRRDCAAALCDLTCTEGGAFKSTIIDQGAVSALTVVALVRSTEDTLTRKVCSKALYNLLDATNAVERMVEEGLVGALTALSGIDDETLEFFAEGVCNVAQYKCGRTEVGKERVLRTLLSLVKSKNPKMHRACAQTLCNLSTFDDGKYCRTVAKAGGMKAIQKLVVHFHEQNDHEMEERCTRTLCALACNAESREIFLIDGGLHTLMGLGKTNSDSIKNQCANVLLSLALGDVTSILAVKQGAMALLLTIASTKVEKTHIACARSMLLFCQQEENRLAIIKQNGVKIANLLGCTELGRRISIRSLTLLALSNSHVASASLIESGAVLEIGRMIGIQIDENGIRITNSTNNGDESGENSVNENENEMEENEVLDTNSIRNTLAAETNENKNDNDTFNYTISFDECPAESLYDACAGLTQLSHRSNTARMVSDHATECLIALLEKFQHDSYVRARVACALRNMSCHSGNLVKMVQAGASKWLIKMASDPNLQTQQHCMVGLCNMADMEPVRRVLVKQGAVAAIMNLSKILRSEEVARQCAVSLSNLAIADGTHDGIVKGGAVSALMWLSKEGMELDEDEEEWEDNYLPSDKSSKTYQAGGSRHAKRDVPPTENNEVFDDMVTAHIRVALPELRGSLPKMPDLQHIAVQMEEPVLCSMQWHMTSVETSVKPPAPPELPNLKIKPVEIEKEEAGSGATAKKDNEVDDDNEEESGGANDSLGMSRVIDITRKHIGKYYRLPRSAESKEKLKKMRLLEKPKPVIIETKGLPSKPAIDSPPPSTNINTSTKDNDTRTNKRNTMLPPLANEERMKQREEKLLHGFANRSISMPNISSFPGNSGFASNLMINNDKSIDEEMQYTRPRIITPGPPIEAPMEQPLSVHFKDTGSFLSHLDNVLGYNVGTRSSIVSSFNRSADNLIHEEASQLSMSTSKLSGIDNSTTSLTDAINVKNKVKQPVMAGKTLLGNSVKIGTKKKQRKAKTCNKDEWPFVTSHE